MFEQNDNILNVLDKYVWQKIFWSLDYYSIRSIRLTCSKFKCNSNEIFREKAFRFKMFLYFKFEAEDLIKQINPKIPAVLYDDILQRFVVIESCALLEEVKLLLVDCSTKLKQLSKMHRELLKCYLQVDRREIERRATPPLLLWAAIYDYRALLSSLLRVVNTNFNEIIYVSYSPSVRYYDSWEDGCYKTSALFEILFYASCYPESEKLYKVTQKLFNHGADPNFMHPLHKLLSHELINNYCITQTLECFKLLLKYGADVNGRESLMGPTVMQRVEKLKRDRSEWNVCEYLRSLNNMVEIVKCAYYFNEAIKCLNGSWLYFFSSYESYLGESRKFNPEFFKELVTHYLTKSWPYKNLSPQGQEKLKQWYQLQNQQSQENQSQSQVEPARFTP